MALDVNSSPEEWAEFNARPMVERLVDASQVAPFPPSDMMYRVSGLRDEQDFAQHGKHLFLALSQASPKPLALYRSILDFGVGSGRVARMFMGFKGSYVGADVDHELVNWVSGAMSWVTPMCTIPREPLRCPDAVFELVIAVSVFTHMNELDSEFYLRELHRVTRPGATLLLTVHGERALKRAETEEIIFNMISVGRTDIQAARSRSHSPGFTFILQPDGHLTTDRYEYGISFTDETYIKSKWSSIFRINRIAYGAIYDFQDIVVMTK
jgi:SAM-dependent methyltransferase